MSGCSPAVLTLLTLPGLIWAASPDPVEIAGRVAQAVTDNRPRQRQYTFHDHHTEREYGSKGLETSRHTRTYEVVRLLDTVYAKLILLDEKPLSAKQLQQQDDSLKEIEDRLKIATLAEKTQRETPSLGITVGSPPYSFAVQFATLTKIFDVQYAGEGEADGRPAYKLEAKPKAGFVAANSNEKESRNYTLKLLVDQHDYFPAVVEAEVTGGDSLLAKTSFWRMEYTRLSDGTWLPKLMVGRFKPKSGKKSWELTSEYLDYKRFNVNADVLSVDEN